MLPSDSRSLDLPRDIGAGQDVDVSVSSKSTTDQSLAEEGKLGSDDSQHFSQKRSSDVLQKRSVSKKSRRSKLEHPHQQVPMKASADGGTETSLFDLCTPEGQIAASKAANGGGNATITWMEAKRAARREYNRLNAARARQRHKSLAEIRDQEIMELKSQVENLTRVNQFLLSQLSGSLVSAHNGASQSPVDPAAVNSSWLWAVSAIEEASATLGNSSAPSPASTFLQAPNHHLLESALFSRLPQQQHQQQSQTNVVSLPPADLSNDLRHPTQQERSDTSMPQNTLPEAVANNVSLLMNIISSLHPSPSTSGTTPGNGILDLLLSLSKSQSSGMSTEDINELRRMK